MKQQQKKLLAIVVAIGVLFLAAVIVEINLKRASTKPITTATVVENSKNDPHHFVSTDPKFSFNIPQTSEIYHQEESKNDLSKRRLSVVVQDKTLSATINVKDDELYLVVEAWQTSADYVKKICQTTEKSDKKSSMTTIGGVSAKKLTYTDTTTKRYHQDICVVSGNDTILLMASVSTKYKNQSKVETLVKTVTDSFKIN